MQPNIQRDQYFSARRGKYENITEKYDVAIGCLRKIIKLYTMFMTANYYKNKHKNKRLH